MENNYYVYEWIRLDTNEPFYVGKGRYNRWRKLDRGGNKHFNNIVKSIPVAVNILHDNLDEQMAYDLECWYIWQYRDIIGYELCNIADGGEVPSMCGKNHWNYGQHRPEETRKKISKNHADVNGKNNPMYGRTHTEEVRAMLSEINSGKNNSKAKSVICLTTKRIFFTCREGAKYYGYKDGSGVAKCCSGKIKYYGRFRGEKLIWKFLIWKHNFTYRPSK